MNSPGINILIGTWIVVGWAIILACGNYITS